MNDLNALKEIAVEAIRRAFPVGDAPPDALMRNDHCSECQETVDRFVGKRWPEIGVCDLAGNPGPSLLTAVGFRYYLPVMMLRAMEAPRELDCFPDSVIGELSPAGSKLNTHSGNRLNDFTADQVHAILAFLRFFESSEKVAAAKDDWPKEAIATIPISRPLSRALKYWQARLLAMST
ncbi:MAG: hypothetical protein K1X64_00360 [Myxococcaceae bacterium]|nr:hypothetical protein [Myxococcaceae bacterium]